MKLYNLESIILVLSAAVFQGYVCDVMPFMNTSLSWDVRVDDLVGRLTLDEIMLQMSRGGGDPYGGPAPAIERLGIGPYSWATECLRGQVSAGEATSFPQALGLAASFSPSLMYDVAHATAEEVRAKHVEFVKHGQYGDRTGLSCFSPFMNIMRHPLWGRNQEVYGEDPYMTGVIATSHVQGLQGNHSRYLLTSSGCKVIAVHGGPDNIPASRFSFDAWVTERDLRLTYLPAHRACVKAGTYSFMCSFNSINGIPACANDRILTDILRNEWNFTGYVVSDLGAIELIITAHKYLKTPIDTVAACLKAGTNLDFSGVKKSVYDYIVDAVKQGKVSEELVRERVKPLFYTRMRLGEFDPPSMNPYSQLNLSVVQSPEHRKLALTAAMKSFVLLKNDKNILPLAKYFNKIAVVGPMADNLLQLFGDYSADIDPKYSTTPYQGLKSLAQQVILAPGCIDNKCDTYLPSTIAQAVQGAQLVVVCLGTGQELEAENNDRSTMDLPANQTRLLEDAMKYGFGTPIILVLFNSGPVNITLYDPNPQISAILECFFPAQSTGEALYNVLTNTGAGANPAARLPFTWYKTADQIPVMTDYSMKERTYRYFTGNPLYPFGYGLSYTTFQYSNLTFMSQVKAGDPLTIQAQVTNTGQYDGEEVVQVYIKWLDTKEEMPQLQLVWFDRFLVSKGDTVNFQFLIPPESMAVWTDANGFVVEAGKVKLYVGGQQPDQQRKVPSSVLEGEFQITGTRILGRF
ncbi:hypothetical protein ACJMK2_027896 [Sinanodonta woodiana]|uniref:Fibronectin type III-like domain-containing protein n=1 Tax=Sinanodonta woodiana TaxID=1069815 RepID=A0ABD3X5B9_SINWO